MPTTYDPKDWKKRIINPAGEVNTILTSANIKNSESTDQHIPLDSQSPPKSTISEEFIRSLEIAHFQLLKEYIARGESLDVIDTKGNTPLHVACSYNHFETAKLLIEANASLDLTDTGGNTSLHLACRHNHFETTKLLIDANANINAENTSNATPLMLATIAHNTKATKYLLSYTPNLNLKNSAGHTALQIASDISEGYKQSKKTGEEPYTLKNITAIKELLLQHQEKKPLGKSNFMATLKETTFNKQLIYYSGKALTYDQKEKNPNIMTLLCLKVLYSVFIDEIEKMTSKDEIPRKKKYYLRSLSVIQSVEGEKSADVDAMKALIKLKFNAPEIDFYSIIEENKAGMLAP